MKKIYSTIILSMIISIGFSQNVAEKQTALVVKKQRLSVVLVEHGDGIYLLKFGMK